MKKKKTNLGKRIHMYNSLQDMEKQFANDVATMGQEFTKIAEENFDPRNPWDQAVMVAILTNMLAYVEVYAELDGVNLENDMKETYKMNLEKYRQQYDENIENMKKLVK